MTSIITLYGSLSDAAAGKYRKYHDELMEQLSGYSGKTEIDQEKKDKFLDGFDNDIIEEKKIKLNKILDKTKKVEQETVIEDVSNEIKNIDCIRCLWCTLSIEGFNQKDKKTFYKFKSSDGEIKKYFCCVKCMWTYNRLRIRDYSLNEDTIRMKYDVRGFVDLAPCYEKMTIYGGKMTVKEYREQLK
jgi:hypothetical protein